MKVNKIDHICIAVKDLEAARKVWEPILGKSNPMIPMWTSPRRSGWRDTGWAKSGLN